MAELTSETAIGVGRQHYAAKRYMPALEQFTRAMKLCPCSRGMKRSRCSCKNFEVVASNNASIFHEAMYTCKCPTGETFNKCDNALHIQALDYRAATFEALGELDRARKDAEWILELAPRLPDGYLRLGKVARLQKKHEFAWKVYNAGIEASSMDSNSSKRQQLYAARKPLQSRFSRRDPLHLPPEIIQCILSQLDFYTLVRCLSVSKSWNQILTAPGHRRLWRRLLFTSPRQRHAPSMSSLRKLISYSGHDVREIVISNAVAFRLTNNKLLALLNGSRGLERLELRQPFEDIHIPIPPDPSLKVLTMLEDLVLDGYGPKLDHIPPPHVNIPYHLLTDAAESLKFLHIRCRSEQFSSMTDSGQYWPLMPRLKCLRIESPTASERKSTISLLAKTTPLLEQLWLDKVSLSFYGLGSLPEGDYWIHLKVLVVTGIHVEVMAEREEIYTETSTIRSINLQHLDLEFNWREEPGAVPQVPIILPAMGMSFPPVDMIDGFKHLRCLRMKQLLFDPQRVQSAVQTTLSDGNLRTFDIVFPLENPESPVGQESVSHLKKYDWARGADSVTCIGAFGFRFVRYPRNNDEFPLPDFLASFKNLETLEISSEAYEEAEFLTVISDILKVTHLKTLYQNQVKGVALDHLRTLAQSHNVKLVWGERPRLWPVPLEPSAH